MHTKPRRSNMATKQIVTTLNAPAANLDRGITRITDSTTWQPKRLLDFIGCLTQTKPPESWIVEIKRMMRSFNGWKERHIPTDERMDLGGKEAWMNGWCRLKHERMVIYWSRERSHDFNIHGNYFIYIHILITCYWCICVLIIMFY